ncbi:MAG: DNA polymerase III subunit alpha, partial [Peptococcaceae bacterium]|nr:DNA polymerase III subunit alpha [Peptococcaceae bacterium]
MEQPFVHLHNHTIYSLLDGASKFKDLLQRAKELNMPAIAITDHGVMHGAVDFYKACQKEGIKPIIGCEVYVAPRTRFDKQAGLDDSAYHLVLLVKNEQGYHNLSKLVSLASLEGFYYKPRVDRELLNQYHEGLIALSGCIAGEVAQKIIQEDFTGAKETALWYRDTFGEGNYYFELQNHGIFEQMQVNYHLNLLHQELGIPLVATNDNHYVYREDAKVQDVMLCIQTGKTLDDANRMKFDSDNFYLKSYQEMADVLGEYPEALANTLVIAEQCNFDFVFGENHMPIFAVPEGYTIDGYLEYLCYQELEKRYTPVTDEARERLAYELGVIQQMGYSGYFLIVWDFIRFAREKGIYVGPGRGSAAGSIVSYVLRITDIDPLKYDLLFERFLNPERVSMPDIDIDFCYERRGEVIDYVIEKYGQDHVCQIITFGTLAAKGAIRDVGRVLNVPITTVNKVAKMIPNELGMTIKGALESSQELRNICDEDEQVRELIATAQQLEGMPRHAGTHAAGVVISQESLDYYLPLQKSQECGVITQYAKENVEEIGLLKMDFLGLRTLTVINKAIDMVVANHGLRIDFDKVDLNDKLTYELLCRGDSIGVFQLESSGLRAIMRDLEPTSLEEVIALVALYRPGPLSGGMADDFIERKHGRKQNEYLHPVLKPILETTYG